MSRRNLMITALALLAVLPLAAPALAEEVLIGGRVLLPGGTPFAKAEVTLMPLTDRLTASRTGFSGATQEPSARALTDAEGRFSVSAPAAGLWRLQVAAEGFVTLETTLQPLIERTELPDAELEPDSGLDVRVVGPDGTPVTGARVRVVTDRSRMSFGRPAWSYPPRQGTTDAEGRLRLQRGERERVTLSAYAAGLAFHQRRGLFGTAASVKLRAGQARVLEVRSKQGKPLPEVAIALGHQLLPVGTTNAQGQATIALAGPKETPVSLLAADGRRLEGGRLKVRKTDPSKPDVLTLPDQTAVSGRMIDARSRRAVSGGLVWDSQNPLFASVAGNQGGFALAGPAGTRMRITAGAPGYLNAVPREFQLANDGRPGPTIALEPAAAIEGKVVDAEGQPISGVEIELRVKRTPGRMQISFGGQAPAPRAISNARGKFRLSPVDPEKSYSVHAKAEGYAPAEDSIGDLEAYQTKTGLRVEMTQGQFLAGTVTDEDGHGLSDATITLKPAAGGGGSGMMRIVRPGDLATRFKGQSEANGRFKIEGLPEGKFDLEVTRSGFAKTKVSAVEITDEAIDLGEVVLSPGESVHGIVVDDDGQPIEGVEVYVKESSGPMMMVMMGPGGGGSGNKVEPDAMTDPAGWFQVADLDTKAPFDLTFNRTGFVNGSQNGLQAPRVEPIEVTLNPASKVEGVVMDSDGEPIPGAKVDMTRSKTIEMGGNVMKTMMLASETADAEGRFVFEDQEPGDISLSAVASGFQEAKLQALVIPKGEDLLGVEIPLPIGAIVEGRVMAPDGRAAVGATVNPVKQAPDGMPSFGGTPTDGEGYYRLEGLAPGKISVEAEHADYPRVVRDIDLKEGINGLTLHFEGGQEVSGRVSDESGNPIGGAGIRLAAAGRYFGGPEAISDGDGTFKIPGVQEGDYTLIAEAENFASSGRDRQIKVAGEPVLGIEITLSRGATVTGTISGVPPEDFSRVGVVAEGASFGGFGGARVDYEGNYKLENLAPGTYTVVASMANSGRQAREQVVIEESTPELRVDLQFSGGVTLSGRALQGDSPVTGATVFTSGIDVDHDGWNQTDQDGRFTIEGLEAGRYKVQLQHMQTGLSYTEEVDVGTSREITLKVPTAVIKGRIVDNADREPLAGVTVILEPAEGDSQGYRPPHAGTTDLEGKFVLDNVGDGNWRMKATKQGYSAVTQTVNVQYQKGPEGLRLSMDPTEGLTLEARLPSGGIPNELRVAVLDGSGAALTSGSYSTGENGRVRLSTVPPGSWELIVSGAGSATSTLRADAPGPAIPVALQPATSLKITVPELQDSNVVGMVRLTGADGRPFRTIGWSGNPRSEWRLTNGRMEFGSLPPGSYTIRVTAGGETWQGNANTSPSAPAEVILDR